MDSRIPARGAVAALAFIAAHAVAATTTVVDIPARSGGTQRFLYTRPDQPIATLVHVPGGTGVLAIRDDGTVPGGECEPVIRNRDAWTSAGLAIASVDATSMGFTRNYDDILEVVRHVRARDNVPVWVIGGSASTGTTENLARRLPGEVGAIVASPQRPSSLANQVRRPTLVIYHSGDPDQFGAAFFNALTGAIVRERSVVTTGSNQICSGFHGFNGADDAFTGAVISFITRHNAATREGGANNYQGLWWKSPAESESGWGLNVTHQGDKLFLTWFTYDADGRGMWLVVPDASKGNGESFSGSLYRTSGPPFSTVPFDPSRVGVTAVGTATLSFAGEDNGTFTYAVNGTTQSKAITRQVFGPKPACTAGGGHGVPPNYQALWWGGEAESGWGVNVAHQGDILFATWFTYDTDGRGMWIVMPNGAKTAGGVYAGSLYRTTGPAFSAQPWPPSGVSAVEVGNGSFAFTDAEHGTFTYTLGGVTQSKAIVRQVFASPPTVCR
jgi:hypothetical protein